MNPATNNLCVDFYKAATRYFTKSIAVPTKSMLSWGNTHSQSFALETGLCQILANTVYQAFMGIYEESKLREETSPTDCRTSLLCIAFTYLGPKMSSKEMSGWLFASYCVGACGAAILRPNNTDRALLLGVPGNEEFTGHPRFLTMRDEMSIEMISKRLRFAFCDSFDSLLLMTDGVIRPFFQSRTDVVNETRWLDFYNRKLKRGCTEAPEGCRALSDDSLSASEKAAHLLQWLGFWSRTSYDDRTILIARPTARSTTKHKSVHLELPPPPIDGVY